MTIEAKGGARFAEGYHALTSACNACHVGIGRSFIVIQVPTASPISHFHHRRARSNSR
jgi:hypothetical protein